MPGSKPGGNYVKNMAASTPWNDSTAHIRYAFAEFKDNHKFSADFISF